MEARGWGRKNARRVLSVRGINRCLPRSTIWDQSEARLQGNIEQIPYVAVSGVRNTTGVLARLRRSVWLDGAQSAVTGFERKWRRYAKKTFGQCLGGVRGTLRICKMGCPDGEDANGRSF
ncbi:hypothetical protein SAMN05216299_10733 [Nitrosospira sp. Nsp14]|nr:hypothetical protein SAMN05216299_10733 [Nitrosospira sp. Nsp14]